MSDYENLTPRQLRVVREIRRGRRRLKREGLSENRDLLKLVRTAEARRSTQRHKFMLLAAAIVGVSAPLLLREPRIADPTWMKAGSLLLLLHVGVGAFLDAIDGRRLRPITAAASASLAADIDLALAEDAELISAIAGEHHPELGDQIKEAKARVDGAMKAFSKTTEAHSDDNVIADMFFFGTFIAGLVLLLVATALVVK
jgi:hypothetical protein